MIENQQEIINDPALNMAVLQQELAIKNNRGWEGEMGENFRESYLKYAERMAEKLIPFDTVIVNWVEEHGLTIRTLIGKFPHLLEEYIETFQTSEHDGVVNKIETAIEKFEKIISENQNPELALNEVGKYLMSKLH